MECTANAQTQIQTLVCKNRHSIKVTAKLNGTLLKRGKCQKYKNYSLHPQELFHILQVPFLCFATRRAERKDSISTTRNIKKNRKNKNKIQDFFFFKCCGVKSVCTWKWKTICLRLLYMYIKSRTWKCLVDDFLLVLSTNPSISKWADEPILT